MSTKHKQIYEIKTTFLDFLSFCVLALFTPINAYTINSLSVKIEILDDSKLNFYYNNVDEIHLDDCIIVARYFDNEIQNYGYEGKNIEPSLGDIFDILSHENETVTLKAGNLKIKQIIIHLNGTNFFTIEWN